MTTGGSREELRLEVVDDIEHARVAGPEHMVDGRSGRNTFIQGYADAHLRHYLHIHIGVRFDRGEGETRYYCAVLDRPHGDGAGRCVELPAIQLARDQGDGFPGKAPDGD